MRPFLRGNGREKQFSVTSSPQRGNDYRSRIDPNSIYQLCVSENYVFTQLKTTPLKMFIEPCVIRRAALKEPALISNC